MKKLERPKARFIADECVGDKTIRFLRSLGYEVESVWGLNLKSAPNGKLIQRAIKDKKIFITEDQDFCNIILYPPRLHSGIIVLKTSRKVEEKVHAVLETMLSHLKRSDFEKALIIVDKSRYRIRRESA
jgi:predicted nuclease of predicted toxin-antitoxin system